MSVVRYEKHGQTATLSLNRPEANNAVNGELIDGISAALHEVEADVDVRCLVLTGEGKMFCSGIDFAGVAQSGFPIASRSARHSSSLRTLTTHHSSSPSQG